MTEPAGVFRFVGLYGIAEGRMTGETVVLGVWGKFEDEEDDDGREVAEGEPTVGGTPFDDVDGDLRAWKSECVREALLIGCEASNLSS